MLVLIQKNSKEEADKLEKTAHKLLGSEKDLLDIANFNCAMANMNIIINQSMDAFTIFLQVLRIFPDHAPTQQHLQKLKNKFSPKSKNVKALISHDAETSYELSFKKGNVINVYKTSNSDWWVGELHGRQGLVPSEKVLLMDDMEIVFSNQSESSTSSAAFVRSDADSKATPLIAGKPNIISDKKFVKALYDFQKKDDNQLSFKKGDVFSLDTIDESGWWGATLNGKKGFVPSTYLELLSIAEVSTVTYSSRIKLLNEYVIACFKTSAEANFYHAIPREAAESLLKICNTGAFLFCSSNQANAVMLSYKKAEDKIIHVELELLNDGTIRAEGKVTTMADYFLPYGNILIQPITVEKSLNNITSQGQSLQSAVETSSHASSTKRAIPSDISTSSLRSAAGLSLQDYHQAIERIAEQQRQAFLGLLQTDYQNLYTEYQRLGQQGFENNFQSQQQKFAKYLAGQQQKLQSQGAEQQNQFADSLQTVLSQYPNQSIVSLSENVLQEVQKKLQTKLGPHFISGIENLLNSQGYQQEVQRMQQGILQRIQERQGQMAMEMIHVQQKQQQIKNEHDPLLKEYQTQQQKLAEQHELQKQESVRAFYNTIEKVLGSRLMSAMSLASGMIVRVSTKSEDRVEMAANIVGKIVDLIPAIGSVANSVIGAGIALGQTVHGKYVDKKQETKFKNTLDSMIRLEDALALAELVARRLAQSYQKYITENYLSVEDTTAAGENAANIVYGCIKSGKLKEYATKSLDEKVSYLVQVVNMEAQKQKEGFFRKASVFKEPASAHISTATRKQVHALGEDLSKVQEQNELATKQAQIKLQQMEKEQAEMKAEFARMKSMQTEQQPSPVLPLRSSSASFFGASSLTSSFNATTNTIENFSLFNEDNWSDAIVFVKNTSPDFFANSSRLQIEPAGKELILKFPLHQNDKEKMLKKLGVAIKKTFGNEIENWEVENVSLKITTNANQTTKELNQFFKQALVAAPSSPAVSTRNSYR